MKRWYRQLHWQILIGLLVGLAIATVLRAVVLAPMPDAGTASEIVTAAHMRALSVAALDSYRAPFAFVGDLFLRLLKLIVLPLIVVSIVSGIQAIGDPNQLGRVGWRTIVYYMATTLAAVTLGIVVVNVIQPGVGLNLAVEGEAALEPTPILEVFRDIIPPNFFAALSKGDMLPTIFVSIIFGLALLLAGTAGEPVRRVFDSLNVVIFKIVDWVMATAPVGVAALLVSTILDPGLSDVGTFFYNLGSYTLAVIAGLGVHGFLVLPLILLVVTGRKPHEYIRALAPALLTAFSTASSSATYPITRECTIDGAGVDRKSADFVLPLGATINMDGTALYEAVAAVFIANAIGFELTFADQLVIVLTATLAAIGAAGVPSAGLVTMIIVLESVGLPAAGYGLVVAVDRILDMCRTTINVWGDAVGAAVVDHWAYGRPQPPGPLKGERETP